MVRSRTFLEQGTPALIGMVEYVAQGDDTYRMVVRPPVQLVSITLAAKMSGKSRDIIYRLYKRRFIEGDQSSPGKIMINMQSLAAHFAESKAEDWWTEERKARYRGR